MILRMQVPDEVYEAYGEVNPKNPRKVMEAFLEKFAGADPSGKQILLEGTHLAELQRLLSVSVDTPGALLDAIRQSLLFKVDEVEVQLTDAQRKKLVTQAAAWKREPAEFIAQQVRENLRSL